jgi:hypothetical protein
LQRTGIFSSKGKKEKALEAFVPIAGRQRPLTLRAHDRRSSLLPLALRPLLSSEFVALDLLLPDALPTGSGKSQVLKERVGSQRRRQHRERGKEEEDDAGGGDVALQVIRSGYPR